MSDKEGAKFLHQRNTNLQTSGPVELAVDQARAHGEHIPNNPDARLEAYLGKVARHSLVAEVPKDEPARAAQLLDRQRRQIDNRIIKQSDIPDSYFATQARAAREQGHGDIEITDEMKHQYAEVLRTDQRESLQDWVTYFTSGDAEYPTWFKYYVLDGVSKLTQYDKNRDNGEGKPKGGFGKRSKGTTDPFPALNREALAYTYDRLSAQMQGGTLQDPEAEKIVKGGNFGKVYALSLAEIGFADPELLKETRGSWVKYQQSSDPRDVTRLSESLRGYGTGWCTAGEGYARTQLEAGDFYIYYSRDKEGKDRVPRVAVRMQNGQVAEVRGIVGGSPDAGPAQNTRQEMEPEMVDIAMDKVKDLPGGEEYFQKAEDMKHLTALDKLITNNPEAELSSADLRFLYELDHEIRGFGYDRDPRIDEIRAKRGDRDNERLSEAIAESLKEQYKTAYTAYSQIANQIIALNGTDESASPAKIARRMIFGRKPSSEHNPSIRLLAEETFTMILDAKFSEWQQNGTLAHLTEQLTKHGIKHTLVATPEADISQADFVAMAKEFGEDQPHKTYVYKEMYEHSSLEESVLAAKPTHDSNGVQISLVPSRTDPGLDNRNTAQQTQIMIERQKAEPELKHRLPSLIEVLTYWQALRAKGDKLADDSTYLKTAFRFFTHKPLESRAFVPFVYVDGDGGPRLYYSTSDYGDRARLLVG